MIWESPVKLEIVIGILFPLKTGDNPLAISFKVNEGLLPSDPETFIRLWAIFPFPRKMSRSEG